MADKERIECPFCGNDDRTLMERVPSQTPMYLCVSCSKEFVVRAKDDRRKV